MMKNQEIPNPPTGRGTMRILTSSKRNFHWPPKKRLESDSFDRVMSRVNVMANNG